MKSLIVWTFLALILLSATKAEEEKKECGGDPEKDGQVTAWFKNAGCTLKPYADSVASTAKKFGNTVVQTYDDVKHRLTDSDEKKPEDSSTPATVTSTEKVLLAPLPGQGTTA
ncbi:uncharacterized protein LOC106089484 [Stomoxys calcitrans]|uniref:Uncharacterized protein n=1 Tax=Stomoxys calcitrans TaxID=35570 RepID=A0A1I8PY18_STOCA|nr:uncharacterized protein LOC106089484 [Stomoxys calcitrans]